tara:strand:+ start:1724 stop:2848 length:1125 start_codon:yes stop_codon:yes gene_type:complete
MKNKLAIIDHVGSKAGMNYYDDGLINGFAENNILVYLLSNFISNNNKCKSKKYFPRFISNNILKFLLLLLAFLRSFLFCKRERIDFVIMHVFNTKFFYFLIFVFSKILRIKIIVIAHDIFSLASDDNTFFKKYIYNVVAYKIIVHNQYSYDKIQYFVKDISKIHIIQQGSYVDILNKNVSKKSARLSLGLSEDKKYILFFGQIKKKKRLDVLLEAFKNTADNIVLIIAGKTWKDDFRVYENIINKYNLDSRIIKKNYFISNEERELIFKASDIMVLPFEEVYQSASILMGMSYSLPVITSDILGFKEFIKDGFNGLLFKKNDSNDLLRKINTIFNSSDLYRKLKKNSLLTMNQNFSWSNIALQYKNILNFRYEK